LSSAAHAGSPELHRGLRRFDVVALTVNSIVGAGVFAMPAGLAINAGRLSLWVVLAACAVVGLLALALAEVASRFDVTGGPQVYAQHTFGPLTGFTVGWLFVVSRFASYALIAFVMLDYAAVLWPALGQPWPRTTAITLFTLVVTIINVQGVMRGAWLGNVLTVAKFVPLALIALAGLAFAGWNNLPTAPPRQPDGLAEALELALFACFGFEVAAIVAGEMRNPGRDLAPSILTGLGISCALYVLLMLACFGVLADTAASTLPLADVATSLVGPTGGPVMAAAAVVSCAGGLALMILVSPRNIFALGESRDLPRPFAAVHARWRTPHVAIIVYGAGVWLLTVTGTFEYLVKVFVISRILAYGSTSVALITLRRREGPAPVPVKGGVLIAVASLIACGAIVLTTDWYAVRDVAIALAVGLVIRSLARRKTGRESPDR
jgi:amino acid transporter